jgi:ubiquitin carboxyl-terminal hydrolase L5
MQEMQVEAQEDAKATQRRYDSGPAIKKWLEMLAENGYLEKNLERFMPGRGGK